MSRSGLHSALAGATLNAAAPAFVPGAAYTVRTATVQAPGEQQQQREPSAARGPQEEDEEQQQPPQRSLMDMPQAWLHQMMESAVLDRRDRRALARTCHTAAMLWPRQRSLMDMPEAWLRQMAKSKVLDRRDRRELARTCHTAAMLWFAPPFVDRNTLQVGTYAAGQVAWWRKQLERHGQDSALTIQGAARGSPVPLTLEQGPGLVLLCGALKTQLGDYMEGLQELRLLGVCGLPPTHLLPPCVLDACPHLGSLYLDFCSLAQFYHPGAPVVDAPRPVPYPSLHTLLIRQDRGVPLPLLSHCMEALPSLSRLHLEGFGWLEWAWMSMSTAAAKQLTSLHVHAEADQPHTPRRPNTTLINGLKYMAPALSVRLTHLEASGLVLDDAVFEALLQLKALTHVRVRALALEGSFAELPCTWQQLHVTPEPVRIPALIRLPLAGHGGATAGLRAVVVSGIHCGFVLEPLPCAVAKVCGSACRLEALNSILRVVWRSAEELVAALPLLRIFQPGSISRLVLAVVAIHDVRRMTLGVMAALAEQLAATPALSACHHLDFRHCDWGDPAACAALLPAVAANASVRIVALGRISEAQLTALCSPAALAAVARPITLHVERPLPADARERVRAGIQAAGRGRLVNLA